MQTASEGETRAWHQCLEMQLVCCLIMSNYSTVSSDWETSEIKPLSHDALFELALQYHQHGRLDEAEAIYKSILTQERDHPDASRHLAEIWIRQGNKFATQGQFTDADRVFSAAASLPGGKPIWNFKSLGFCPTIFPDVPSIDAYWQHLDQGLDLALAEHFDIDWRTLPADGFMPHFNLSHQGRCYKDIRVKFARIFEPFFPQERPARKSRQRYRIGFLVFSRHEGGFLRGTAGILKQLDRKRFEIVVLCPGSLVDRCRQSIRSDEISFVPLGGTFEQIVGQVRDADCDLIYHWKAGSDPWSYFMPFARLAPVQCTSYGTHGTSGISAVDYFLSSSFIEPSDAGQHYSERLLCMNAIPTYQRQHRLPENVARNEFGLPEQESIYFCPHRLPKYHPSFDRPVA